MNNDIQYLEKYLCDKTKYEEALLRLEKGEPVQYIVGNVNFHGFEFDVDNRVLIPRFETEELVERLIDYMKKNFDKRVDIVDIGTGSGCIAITLKEKTDSNVDAVDISSEALEVANSNAKKLNVEIMFYEGNMLEPLNKKYDIIVSNPPYIDETEDIMDIVKNNEPHIALYAQNSGLEYYEVILSSAKDYLREKSIIAFEIGYAQGESLKLMARKYFPTSEIIVEKDMQNRERFLFVLTNL